MSQKANSRKKILIAAVLAGVLIIGAIVSIVLVLAASAQGISSNITVSYNAEGVAARVSANYAVVPNSGAVTKTAMTTSGGGQEIVFNLSTNASTETISPAGNIVLDPQNQTVVFEYRFQNIAESGFTVGLTTTGEEENNYNINETFYVSGSQLPASEYGRITESSLAKQAMLNYDDILYIYVKVSVAKENLSAAYNKAYNWELKQITSEEVIVTLNDNGGTNGLTSVNAVTGAATPILEKLPTAPEGQGFIGYYDATSGGTQYISKSGVGLKEITGAITLYAQYSEEAVLDITNGVLYGINPTSTTTTLTELNVPTSVTEIGESAFENNTSITSVNFGDAATASYASGSSLRKIGAKAFKGCTGLTELVIPEGVTEFGVAPFANCINLVSLEFPYVLGVGIDGEKSAFSKLFGMDNSSIPVSLVDVTINGGTEIGFCAFLDCSNITNIILGQSVINVENSAFQGCSSLENITIPNNLINIGAYAFMMCKSLTKIVIPNSVTDIGYMTFFGCESLESVVISNNITDIGEATFYGCTALTNVQFNENSKLETIGVSVFAECSQLTHLEMPSNVTNIGESILQGCTSLVSLEFPYVINPGFEDMDVLEYVSGLSTLFGGANGDIPSTLTDIVINGGTLGDYAFAGCSNLKNITINPTVSLGMCAFAGCTNIETLQFPYLFRQYVDLFEDQPPSGIDELKINAGDISSTLGHSLSQTYITNLVIGEDVASIESTAFAYCYFISNITFENVNGWKIYESATSTDGTAIDVSNPTTNMEKLVADESGWMYYYLKRS